MMMKLKVVNVDGQAAVVLPPELLRRLDVGVGGEVEVENGSGGIVIRREGAVLSEQLAIADRVMREDADILRKLAQ
jgi:antitoxin component of MazEF toxin-antitoxin module